MPPSFEHPDRPQEQPDRPFDLQQWAGQRLNAMTQFMQGNRDRFSAPIQMGQRVEPSPWMNPNGRFLMGGPTFPRAFAAHPYAVPGPFEAPPMHQVINIHRMPPVMRFQYHIYQQQMLRMGMPQSPYPSTPGRSPSYPNGFYRPFQPTFPDMGWRWGYAPGRPMAPRYPQNIRPSASPALRPRRGNEKATEWDPTAERITAQAIAEALRDTRVLGKSVTLSASKSYFQKFNIPPTRIDEHVAALKDMAARVEQATKQRGWEAGDISVVSDGCTVTVTNAKKNESIRASHTQLLRAAANPPTSPGKKGGKMTVWESITDGSRVEESPTSTGTEYVSQGKNGRVRVVELRDGRILREQGADKTPGVSSFYDGSPASPRIVRVTVAKADVPLDARGGGKSVTLEKGMHVVGEGGIVPMRRPRTPKEAEEYLRDVAVKLRTPEAIGAFVSSYLTKEDRVGTGGRRIAALSTVNFKGEKAGKQYIQSAMETVMKGSGDCEDFAVLANKLMTLAGHPSVVARESFNHYVCAYLEKAGREYVLCTIDTGGFKRLPRLYPTAADAMAAVWHGRERSGVDWELKSTKGMSQADIAAARRAQGAGGGLSLINGDSIRGGSAQLGYVAYRGGMNWEQLVYQQGNAGRPRSFASLRPSGNVPSVPADRRGGRNAAPVRPSPPRSFSAPSGRPAQSVPSAPSPRNEAPSAPPPRPAPSVQPPPAPPREAPPATPPAPPSAPSSAPNPPPPSAPAPAPDEGI